MRPAGARVRSLRRPLRLKCAALRASLGFTPAAATVSSSVEMRQTKKLSRWAKAGHNKWPRQSITINLAEDERAQVSPYLQPSARLPPPSSAGHSFRDALPNNCQALTPASVFTPNPKRSPSTIKLTVRAARHCKGSPLPLADRPD